MMDLDSLLVLGKQSGNKSFHELFSLSYRKAVRQVTRGLCVWQGREIEPIFFAYATQKCLVETHVKHWKNSLITGHHIIG